MKKSYQKYLIERYNYNAEACEYKNRNGFYVHSDCLLAALQLLDKSKKTTEKEKRK